AEEFEKSPDAGMVYHSYREFHTSGADFRESGLPVFSGFLPASTRNLLSYVLFPTSFLAFRRSALQLLMPIPGDLVIQADSHLSGLMIFAAPICGVADGLGVYRVHGGNLFTGRAQPNRQRQELRLRTRRALMNGMKHWLTERGWDLRRADLHAFFKQWDLA